jgi:CubicO group peptidase (beta-lactamase class C family)
VIGGYGRGMTRSRVLPALLVAGLVFGACGGDDDDAASPTTATASTSAPTTTPATTTPASTTPPTTAPATSAAPATTAPATSAPATTDAPDDTSSGDAYDFSAVGPVVQAFVDDRGLNGAGLVVVDAEDGIVHEEYWGELGPDRISLVASSTKMVTAGVLLRLQDDGLLDIDAPIADYVPWGSGNPDVTVAQLLSNSSGLVGLLPDPGYAPYVCQFLPAGTLEACGEQIFTTPADDADVIPPDTQFRYGGAQWQVAGAVAEAVSGKPWAQLIDEIYVQPCGLDALGYNNHFTQIGEGFDYPVAFEGDPSVLAATDNPNMEGGMYTDPDDYAALLLMHLRGGTCDGTPVLSPEALEAMHSDRIGEVYGGDALPGTGYGMGWWVDRSSGRINDPGAYGSVPWLDLDDGFGAYLVIEADTGTGNELAALLYEPVEAAVLAAR